MPIEIGNRLSHAWNAFMNPTQKYESYSDIGPGSSYNPDRAQYTRGNDRTIINMIYTRIAIDCASIPIFEGIIDENGNVKEKIKSGLTNALTVEANIDQTGRVLMQNAFMSLFDEGCIAIVVTDADVNPNKTESYDIKALRVGKITQWYPKYVEVELYNEKTGLHDKVILPKKIVSIIENPFYSVMNESNSISKRLVRKLALLDRIDERTGSGKMDLIIQLPYVVKSEARRRTANERRAEIEQQLANSKYGIAYIDGTEKVTQLGHSLENNLQGQIEYLTSMLYSQLGLTEDIFKGTADEQTMLNYYTHTIEPILSAFADEFLRKFLTKTARTRGHAITYIRDPFKLVPVNNLAEIADKFTRNEILTSNEVRSIIGFKPSEQASANELRNKNINQSTYEERILEENQNGMLSDEVAEETTDETPADMTKEEFDATMAQLDKFDEDLNSAEKELTGKVSHSDIEHYASPYYDPEYAHEYYMKHRQLKGTSGLNDTGKEAATNVKQNLNAERDRKIKQHKLVTNSAIESHKEKTDQGINSAKSMLKSRTEEFKNQMQKQIDNIKLQLKNMPPEQKAAQKEKYSAKISQLREQNSAKREELKAAYSQYATSSRELHSDTKEKLNTNHKEYRDKVKQEYETKYENEMAKIHNDESMQKQKKSSGKGHTTKKFTD